MNYGKLKLIYLLTNISFSSRSPSLNNETLLAEIACMLIEAGANVNQIDKDHFTPLIYGIEILKRYFFLKKIFF
jgi:hypothetical protein